MEQGNEAEIDTQPKGPVPDLRFSWMDFQQIGDLPNVNEAICNLEADPTEDNATCLIRAVVEAAADRLAALAGQAPAPVAATAHNFGKPLGWGVVAICPDNPDQDGMLCGGAHTFKSDAEKAAKAEGYPCRVVPLGPFVDAQVGALKAGWISVNSRIPQHQDGEDGMRVLVLTADHDFGGVQVHDIPASDFYAYDPDDNEPGTEVTKVATHWMPRDVAISGVSPGDRDEAIRVWHKHCDKFSDVLGKTPPSAVIDAMLAFAGSQPPVKKKGGA